MASSSVDLRHRRSNFGKARSLSQYAVSLPSQPEDVSGVHPNDDEFNFFKKGRDFQSHKAKHHYTADELRVLATYESADSLPSHTEVYRQWLEKFPPRRHLETWGIVTIVGVLVGLLGFVIKECTEAFQIFKNPFVGDYIERGEIYRLWMYYAFLSCSLAALSAIVCVYICPSAAGSGLPEIIGILNGVVVRNMLSCKTMFYKIISCLLTVLSGLPVGFEGPLVHIGGMVAASLARPANSDCSCRKKAKSGTASNSKFYIGNKNKRFQTVDDDDMRQEPRAGCFTVCRYRDCKERHNLICMGAAAGVASAFSAPITGLLFAMEEMSSFWNATLTWQTFVCCILARSVTELLRSIVSTLTHISEADSATSLLEFTESALFDTKEDVRLNLIIILPTIALGVFGGLTGALFIFLYLKAARFRRKILAKIGRPEVLNAVRVFEPVFVAMLCTLVIMGCLPLFHCKPVDSSAPIYNAHEGKFLRFQNFQCEEYLNITFSKNQVTQRGEFQEFATLVFGSWEQMIRSLLSRKTLGIFSSSALLIILVFFFFFCIWASLCFIANGLLIPTLAIGALYGRLFGQVLVDILRVSHLSGLEAGNYEWLDPGVFALIGMASFLSGTARLPVTTVVMMVEMTNDINLSLLVMISVMIAKFVGDRFTHPLYHSLLEFKCIPYLEDDLNVYKDGKRVNLELFKAADVMTTPVHIVNVNESLQVLSNLLLDTNHGAFPVVQPGFGFRRTFLGMITRLELTILLTKTVGFNLNEIARDDIEKIQISYPEYSSSKLRDTNMANEILNNFAEHHEYSDIRVNLLPYINTSSYFVPSQFSLNRTYMIFRTLGARHLVVTDTHNQVMGIITRKDLMGFVIDDKIKALLVKQEGKRPPGHFSPSSMLNFSRKQNNNQSDSTQPFLSAASRANLFQKMENDSGNTDNGVTKSAQSLPHLGKQNQPEQQPWRKLSANAIVEVHENGQESSLNAKV